MSSAGADLVFGQVTLSAYSYMAGGSGNAALHIPFELAQDSTFPIVPFVARKLGTRLARKQAVDLATGTGSSQPKGLFWRIPEVMRYATLGMLASITDTTGRPIFQPLTASNWQQADMTGGSTPRAPDGGGGYRPSGILLGYPVYVDQASPVVANASIAKPGAAGDAFISFGDHRQAYVRRPIQDITLLVDPYTQMAKRQIGYFTWARQDATIQNAKAHVLLAGWNAA